MCAHREVYLDVCCVLVCSDSRDPISVISFWVNLAAYKQFEPSAGKT